MQQQQQEQQWGKTTKKSTPIQQTQPPNEIEKILLILSVRAFS